ncbi:hypothetical protein M1271_00075 [Patescibacteria group bacterium]|nr:hypothetical protein [Patescibacteria group bacterium]
MPFFIFAWIGAVGYGLTTILLKLTSKHSIKNPWMMNYLYTFFFLLFTTPVALINHISLPSVWINIFFAAFFYSLYFIFVTLSIYMLDVTTLSPLYNFRAAFSVFLGVIFLHEALLGQKLFLIIIILLAGFFVSLDEKMKLSSFFQKGILLALTAMISLSLTGMFVNRAIADVGYWNATFWMYLLIQIMMLLTLPLFFEDLRKINKLQISSMATTGLVFVLGDLAANRAYSVNLGISSVIISLPISMILAFLFSILSPKLLEKHTIKVYAVRFSAAAIMIIAALKLTL